MTLIPGDGVGIEITNSVKEIFDHANVPVEFEEFKISGETSADEAVFRRSMDSLRRNKVGLKGEISSGLRFEMPIFFFPFSRSVGSERCYGRSRLMRVNSPVRNPGILYTPVEKSGHTSWNVAMRQNLDIYAA